MLNNYIIHSDGSFISEDELYHHGIKGMKWGVRKYQNPDGSLTAKGKKRYKIMIDAADKAKSISDIAKKDSELYSRKAESAKTEKLTDSQYKKFVYDMFGVDGKNKKYVESEAKQLGYKDSKEMAADHLGIGQMGSANYKALATRAKKAADFYSKLSDSYKNTPVSTLSKKQIKKAKDFKKHGYLDNVSYNDFNLKYDQEKYGL